MPNPALGLPRRKDSLVLSEITGSHGSDHKDYSILGYSAV
jgi:hypothetical protein